MFGLPKWATIVSGLGIVGIVILSGLGLWWLARANDDTPSESIPPTQTQPTPPPPIILRGNLPSITPSPTITPSLTLIPSSSPPSATLEATAVAIAPSATPTPIANQAIPNTNCPPPSGWELYTIQAGDTLFAFQLGANRAGNPTTVDEILLANCLDSTFILEGQTLWLPSGAAENAPSSEAPAPNLPAGVPRVAACEGCSITILAGWRLEQIADEINRLPVAFSGADFLALTQSGAPIPPRDFLASVPPGGSLEGFMLPGTYALTNDMTAAQFRDMVLDSFGVTTGGIAASNLTSYQTVILASIIQRESRDPNEQRLISSVFHNRMNAGKGLGATVTLQYAVGRAGDWWPRPYAGITDLDSPYNTNRRLGLPPTAISNPSVSALQAAANPAQTNYFYFTGNCEGTHNLYAATYEEHLANTQCP